MIRDMNKADKVSRRRPPPSPLVRYEPSFCTSDEIYETSHDPPCVRGPTTFLTGRTEYDGRMSESKGKV